MIIGIETSSVKDKTTGTSRYIKCFLEQLSMFDHEIKLFSANTNSKEKKSRFNYLSILNRGGLQRHFYHRFILNSQLSNANVDCAIFPNYFLPPGFNKPSAIVIHDLSFLTHKHFYSKLFTSYYSYQLKETLKHNPLVITISEHTKNVIKDNLAVKENNIFLVQGYSDIHKKESLNKEEIEPYFLYVGHIEPRKNIIFLVENFLKWKAKTNLDIKLKIVGEVWIRTKEIDNLLRRMENNKSVEVLDYVSEDKLRYLYKNAAAFVHTSFVEGFGFPVLEAMHFNLPILCSKNTAAEEISTANSISIDPSNSEDLLNGFDKVYERYINNNITYEKIQYSPELMHEQMSNVLEVLEKKVENKFYNTYEKATTAEAALLKTLIYSSLFNSGIKLKSLKKFVFDYQFTNEELENTLISLYNKRDVYIENEFVFLNHSLKAFDYKNDYKIDKEKLEKTRKLLNKLPFVSMIALSGGSANYGIDNHNDVDVFIITKPDTLYIVYLIIHLFSKLFKIRNTLCANYLVDEKAIVINDHRDLYVAHQIVSLVPFKNKNMLYYFLEWNKWILDFFPNIEIKNVKIKFASRRYILLKPFNKLTKLFYKLVYRKKISNAPKDSIKIEDNCLKLHTNDHRIKIMKEFEQKCDEFKQRYGANIDPLNTNKKRRILIPD